MSKETRQPFASTGDYIARRGFRFHGRNFALGDNFPWRHLACSVRKLKQLYEGRFIEPRTVLEPRTALDKEEGKNTKSQESTDIGTDTSTEDVTEDSENTDTEETSKEPKDSEEKKEEKEETLSQGFTFNPKSHKIKSVGAGVYAVTTKGGKPRLSVTRKEAQRLKKVKKPTEVQPEEVVG